jgi:type II secretory pathway pseudopilin PulG
MKQGQTAQGYTIVEVIIVMAVTAALLISALALISGQQAKTEFVQSINDINSQIQDVMNDVATGFYPSANSFTCTVGASGPNLTQVARGQGTNVGCTFLGKVLHFGVQGSNGADYKAYTVVGLRQSAGKEATSFTEAKPTIIDPDTFPASTNSQTLKSGLKVVAMKYANAGVSTNTGAVAFMGSLASYGANSTNLVSGSLSVSLIPLTFTPEPTNPPNLDSATVITNVNSLGTGVSYVTNPDNGVIICFQSGGTDQYGVITIGGSGRTLTTDLKIYNSLGEANAVIVNGVGVCT